MVFSIGVAYPADLHGVGVHAHWQFIFYFIIWYWVHVAPLFRSSIAAYGEQWLPVIYFSNLSWSGEYCHVQLPVGFEATWAANLWIHNRIAIVFIKNQNSGINYLNCIYVSGEIGMKTKPLTQQFWQAPLATSDMYQKGKLRQDGMSLCISQAVVYARWCRYVHLSRGLHNDNYFLFEYYVYQDTFANVIAICGYPNNLTIPFMSLEFHQMKYRTGYDCCSTKLSSASSNLSQVAFCSWL